MSNPIESVSSGRIASDLEGTLVNLEDFHQQSFDLVAISFGLGLRFTPADLISFSGKGDRVISEFLCGEVRRLAPGIQIEPDEIRRQKTILYREVLHDTRIQPRSGVLDYMEEARRLTGSIVIASLTNYEDAMHIIKSSGLNKIFDHILTERSVTNLKPAPDIYLLAALTLGVSPQRVLVHEDSPTGVQAAISAGCPVIAFPVLKGIRFDPVLPNAIFPGWEELDPRQMLERFVA